MANSSTLPPPRPVSDEDRSAFLRGVAHELRTPLHAVLGFSEVLLSEVDGPLGRDARESLGIVRDSAQRLLALVNDALDLVTVASADPSALCEPIEVAALLFEARDALVERHAHTPVHVRAEPGEGVPEARGSRVGLSRALLVLLSHALRVTDSGEVRVTASAEPDDTVALRVTGDGLLASNAELSDTLPEDRRRQPAHLRLAIARQLATQSGASLQLEAEAGGRASYVLRLPLATARPSATASGASEPPASFALHTRFLASLAHDLRTPLHALLGFADLLALAPAPELTPAQRGSLQIVRERGRDLLALVDDMIDWARLDAGVLQLQPAPCDAAALVERAIALALERSGTRGLVIERPEPLPQARLQVDDKRFVQALVGLVDHAARASTPVTLTLQVQRVEAASGPQLRITIHDPELSLRAAGGVELFTAFRPSFAPTGQRALGLSLGPAIARMLLRAQGGDVWWERALPRGTRFVVSVPMLG